MMSSANHPRISDLTLLFRRLPLLLLVVVIATPAYGQSRAALEAAKRIRAQRAAAAKQKERAGKQGDVTKSLQPFLKNYCLDCHGEDTQEAGIRVDQLKDSQQLLTERKDWERVYRMINSSIMPPGDHDPMPTAEERSQVTDFLHEQLFNFDCELVDNPGRSTVQRLNRSEYNNTIRDLFGIDIRPADKFPADDVGEGFDNIGDVLSLPPLLLEKYLDAAEVVADAVVFKEAAVRKKTQTFTGDQLKATEKDTNVLSGFRVLSSNGELFTDVKVPVEGEYRLRIVAAADQAGDEKAKFELLIGEKKLTEWSVKDHRKPQTFERKVKLRKGNNRIAAKFVNDFYDPKAEGRKDRNSVSVRSPFTGRWKGQVLWFEP